MQHRCSRGGNSLSLCVDDIFFVHTALVLQLSGREGPRIITEQGPTIRSLNLAQGKWVAVWLNGNVGCINEVTLYVEPG